MSFIYIPQVAPTQIVGPWQLVDIAADQTDLTALLSNAFAAGFVFPRTGSIRSITGMLSANAAGANLTANIFKNGVVVGSTSLVITAGTNKAFLNFNIGGFAGGDAIDVRVSTPVGWTSTTADGAFFIETQF